MLNELKDRAHHRCELCSRESDLKPFSIDSNESNSISDNVLLCEKCSVDLESKKDLDPNHWRCLNDSMWSEHLPVQILAYRALSYLKNEAWAIDLKSQMYFDDESLKLAEKGLEDVSGEPATHFDSNGAQLCDGDSVTLIKDLVVKGANFTAKRGTMVRGISLSDNAEHIDGRVNGVKIVLVTKFLKKVNG